MALNKSTLKADIKLLLQDMMTKETDSMDEFADRLSTMIDSYIKSATVTVQAGIVLTAGGYPGTTTGTGTAQIS